MTKRTDGGVIVARASSITPEELEILGPLIRELALMADQQLSEEEAIAAPRRQPTDGECDTT